VLVGSAHPTNQIPKNTITALVGAVVRFHIRKHYTHKWFVDTMRERKLSLTRLLNGLGLFDGGGGFF